jgi:hypothetical protein
LAPVKRKNCLIFELITFQHVPITRNHILLHGVLRWFNISPGGTSW